MNKDFQEIELEFDSSIDISVIGERKDTVIDPSLKHQMQQIGKN